jgi:hypothetical protein
MGDLRTQGYKTSEFQDLKATPLSANLAMVTGAIVWRKADGSELQRAGVTYTMRRNNSWELAVTAIHDLRQ